MNCPWYPPTTYDPAAGTGVLLANPPFASPSMFPLTTTLNHIKACDPCIDGWQEGLQAAGKTEPDDEPISYEAILDAVGIEKALWCCRAEKQHANLWRRYAVWCARRAQYLIPVGRRILTLDVAERHTARDAARAVWAAARDAAGAAAWAAWAAEAAGAAWAAGAAGAAWAATWEAQSSAFRQLVTTGTLPAFEQEQEVAP